MFYAWCVRAKLLAKSPFLEVDMRVRRPDRNNMLAHLDVSGGIQKVNELALRHTPGLPRPLGIQELRRITSELSLRDRLMVEWGLTTGARRMEVAALGVRALLQSSRDDAMPRIRLTRTKGDKPRLIYPPLQLVDRTLAYMREERAALVARIKRKRTTWTEPETVFISTKGRRMTPRSVGAMFVAAARKSQVHATYHSLRHTYAVTMLALLQRHASASESLNPLLTLQVLLGHANISSTSIYLRVLATDMAEVERSVDDLYEALR
jgi:site-specific recombinase XerD